MEGVPIGSRQPHKQQRIPSIVVRQVVRLGCILYEPFAFFTANSDDKRVWFRRGMSGQACHEAAAQLQYRRSVVLRSSFNVRQRERNSLDDLEPVRRLLLFWPSFHRRLVSTFARRGSTQPCAATLRTAMHVTAWTMRVTATRRQLKSSTFYSTSPKL